MPLALVANIYKYEREISCGLGGIHMDEFFEEIIERAHYYEQFELFRECKQTFQRNQRPEKASSEEKNS